MISPGVARAAPLQRRTTILAPTGRTRPAVPPPIAAGQAAIFDSTGSAIVAVTSGPINPDSWTFNATSQSFSISGADVNFSGAGILNNASAGQTIAISNNIGEAVAGAGVQQ